MDSQQILNTTEKKIAAAIRRYAEDNSFDVSEVVILINGSENPTYSLLKREESLKRICALDLDDILQLSFTEQVFINKKSVNNFIATSIRKISIGAKCDVLNLSVMLYLIDNRVKLYLYKDNQPYTPMLLRDLI